MTNCTSWYDACWSTGTKTWNWNMKLLKEWDWRGWADSCVPAAESLRSALTLWERSLMNGILTAGRSSSSCEGSIGEDKNCGSDLTHQRMIQSLKRALQWSRVRWHPRARFRDDGSPWDWVTSFWFGSAGSPRRPIPVLSICCFAKAVGTDVSSTQMRLVISTVVHRSDVDGHEQHWEMKVELI